MRTAGLAALLTGIAVIVVSVLATIVVKAARRRLLDVLMIFIAPFRGGACAMSDVGHRHRHGGVIVAAFLLGAVLTALGTALMAWA